ncbi:MAG TPA: hypothetical protein VNP04_05730 [Alphaproteobacteria bacterium]|nr:hypothetical protein [Alphaproteobacteria bacterium]
MTKLDRLGWADGIAFTAHGVRLGVRVSRAEALDQVRAALPPGSRPLASPMVDRLYSLFVGGSGPRPGIRRYHLLYGDAVLLARTLELAPALEALESDLHRAVAERSRRRLFVHAGVVAWRGRAIVMPGRSFSGKTTLVAEWVQAGASYYSDEYAVFDAQGRVHPYTKPLSLRQSGGITTKCTVEALRGRAGARPLPVGLVIVSTYKPGARWRPRRLSPGQGGLALLSHAVSARQQPEAALTVLRHVVSAVPVLKGVRGEAREAVRSVIDQIEASKGFRWVG